MPRPKRAIGIDIGGTKTAVAAVDAGGAIVARDTLATEADRGFDRAMTRIVESLERVLAQAGWSKRDLCGVGIGCTGPVSAERGVIDNPYTLPGWVGCPIVDRLQRTLGLGVTLENDADAAVLGECFAGGARGASRVVMLTLGTGVGGGVVIDGRIYRGAGGEHPELGHIPIDPAGAACHCGTAGCLEAIASGTAIAAAGRALGFADSRDVFSKAALGDAAASTMIKRVRSALSTATWTLLHTFMPDLIVLGGGVIDEHYDQLAAAVERPITLATMVPKGSTRVVKAQLGNDAGIVGAASLALSR